MLRCQDCSKPYSTKKKALLMKQCGDTYCEDCLRTQEKLHGGVFCINHAEKDDKGNIKLVPFDSLPINHTIMSFVLHAQCPAHNMPKSLYCMTELRPICPKCAEAQHQNHEIIIKENLPLAAESLKDEIRQILSNLQGLKPIFFPSDGKEIGKILTKNETKLKLIFQEEGEDQNLESRLEMKIEQQPEKESRKNIILSQIDKWESQTIDSLEMQVNTVHQKILADLEQKRLALCAIIRKRVELMKEDLLKLNPEPLLSYVQIQPAIQILARKSNFEDYICYERSMKVKDRLKKIIEDLMEELGKKMQSFIPEIFSFEVAETLADLKGGFNLEENSLDLPKTSKSPSLQKLQLSQGSSIKQMKKTSSILSRSFICNKNSVSNKSQIDHTSRNQSRVRTGETSKLKLTEALPNQPLGARSRLKFNT